MANGGHWLFSITGTPIVLGINNGVAPVFPAAQANAFNIEVFTNPTVNGVPGPELGFQASIADSGGTLESGFYFLGRSSSRQRSISGRSISWTSKRAPMPWG